MISPSRTHSSKGIRKYFSAIPLVPPVRLDWLPPATFDWREARHWFWPMVLLVGVGVLYLMQSSFATTSELEIARLVKDRDAVARRHAQLTVEIAELEKPARVRERALGLGLVDTSKNTLMRLAVPSSALDSLHTLSLFTDANDHTTLWQSMSLVGAVADEFARWTQHATKRMELLLP